MQTRQSRLRAIGPKTSAPAQAAGAKQPTSLVQALLQRGLADEQSMLHLQRSMGNQAVCELLGVQSRKPTGSGKASADLKAAPVQRKFGFEIELPMLLTQRIDTDVPSLAGGADLNMPGVPMDPGLGGKETELVPLHDGYINADHNQTLNPLYYADLDQYAIDRGLDANETASLKAERAEFIPHAASIAEVVTDPWGRDGSYSTSGAGEGTVNHSGCEHDI